MDRKDDGASFQIVVDGKSRSYRDTRDTALEAGIFLKEQHPPSEVMLHYYLYCLDLDSGKVKWKQEFYGGRPPGGRHRKNSFASETPITDGKNVYVYIGNLGLWAFDLKGKQIRKLPLTGALSVDELERIGPKIVLFEIEGYITAPRWVCWSSGSRELRTVEILSPPYPISFGDAEVVREFATSRDGTRVPLNIIRRK